MPQVELNTPAPDFVLSDFYGKNVQLSGYQNSENVVIVFNLGFN
jgi:peroxiredoxin